MGSDKFSDWVCETPNYFFTTSMYVCPFFIEELSFPNNLLSDDSIQSLVKIVSISPIKMVDVTNNKIACEGAKVFGK